MNRFAAIIILMILALLFFSSLPLDYGYPQPGVSAYYLSQGVADTGALNIVTAIYLDYRAFDTLGEATVFFAAALGVFMLLRKRGGGETD